MQKIFALLSQSHARVPVLLIGESGTGKNLITESIHHGLKPANEQFVTLLSRRTNQSILEKFDNLLKTNKTYTFFFERVEFLSIPMQQQLLQILNKLSLERHMFVGSIGDDPIDLISNGQLLKDLYYYFASMTIYIPPLIARKEDIMPFVNDYFSRHRERFASIIDGLSEDVIALFLQYNWTGNLKELELLLDEIASMITNEKIVTY
ncbi:sigma 54-interacting transcriptional regulator [Ureibacillus sp. GCM10028918]|uniref:sigma 54-interacting transcriptional regulator n=1 Tax=Ureibacillus sp. GCM10028918 TaxID=3273429 RepID=UPI003617419F